MNERLKLVRSKLGMSQREFSSKINIGHSTLAMLESGDRIIKDIHISQICSAFNISEEWLRFGNGEMFVQLETFSLDEYAKANGLSELEFDIIKGYIELDADLRHKVLSHFKGIFDKHAEVAATRENNIEKKLESYRLELEAEQKGETSLASHQPKGKLG